MIACRSAEPTRLANLTQLGSRHSTVSRAYSPSTYPRTTLISEQSNPNVPADQSAACCDAYAQSTFNRLPSLLTGTSFTPDAPCEYDREPGEVCAACDPHCTAQLTAAVRSTKQSSTAESSKSYVSLTCTHSTLEDEGSCSAEVPPLRTLCSSASHQVENDGRERASMQPCRASMQNLSLFEEAEHSCHREALRAAKRVQAAQEQQMLWQAKSRVANLGALPLCMRTNA